MKNKLFGTDGIRGVAGKYPLDDETVFAVGAALGESMSRSPTGSGAPPAILIGMDTRESGPGLAELMAGGFEARGAGVKFAGVLTTPGVAHLTQGREFDGGVMISASHNPFEDNGIKVFGSSGFKLSDSEEHWIEAAIFRLLEQHVKPQRRKMEIEASAANRYLDHLSDIWSPDGELDSFRVVVDCANGAASELAPRLFARLGVTAEFIGNHPDGRNINRDCGSLHLDGLSRKVIESGADLGIAFDGDADRALFVAENGQTVDGDVVLLLAARHMAERKRLTNHLVVTTLMANMGLEKALGESGIKMVRTPVGDKYVLEEMLQRDAALGGEQSGHIIFREHATTGDGLLTACALIEILSTNHEPLSKLARRLTVFPQTIKNVRVAQKPPLEDFPALAEAIQAAEEELAGRGRVIVRYSGTEPLLRIMVEAEKAADVERHSSRLARVVEEQLGDSTEQGPGRPGMKKYARRMLERRRVPSLLCQCRCIYTAGNHQLVEWIIAGSRRNAC